MKLLLFSDLHANLSAARQLVQRASAEGVEVLVGAGDFGNMRRNYAETLEVLRGAGLPLVIVGGNNESAVELLACCKGDPRVHVLQGAECQIGAITFFGLGGGVPTTPFGTWSWDFTEAQAAGILRSAPPGCVLISHSPPQGVVDRSSRGDSLGSTAVRDAILRLKPRLVVCGHIHGSGGQTGHLGATPIVNAGPAGVVWEI